jgi:hypothetical protein
VAGFWAAAGDALLMFPLTRACREALLALACANSGSAHNGGGGSSGGSHHGSRQLFLFLLILLAATAPFHQACKRMPSILAEHCESISHYDMAIATVRSR